MIKLKKSLLYDSWVNFFGPDPARLDYTWTALPATTTAAIVCVPNDFFQNVFGTKVHDPNTRERCDRK